MILATVAHARLAKLDSEATGVLCAPGIRTWAERYSLDLAEFLRSGIPVEQLEAIDDAFAQRVAKIARQEAGNGR